MGIVEHFLQLFDQYVRKSEKKRRTPKHHCDIDITVEVKAPQKLEFLGVSVMSQDRCIAEPISQTQQPYTS